MKRDDKKRQNPLGQIIAAAVVLAVMNPAILAVALVLGLPAGIGWLIFRSARKQNTTAKSHTDTTWQKTTFLEDCSIPLHMHRDKGTHHVRRGRGEDPWDNLEREIDPWDRPDIDIRKYQRR